jgi:phosphoribosylformylglycinamidine synthase
MDLLHFYRTPALSEAKKNQLVAALQQRISNHIQDIQTEFCFNVDITAPLTRNELDALCWLLSETFEPEKFSDKSFLGESKKGGAVIFEVGPRMNFTTAWSTNAVSICHACGIKRITRIERSRRYKFIFSEQAPGNLPSARLASGGRNQLNDFYSSLITDYASLLYDRMTECPYPHPLRTFEVEVKPEPVFNILLIEKGRGELENINREMGLGLDEWDIDYYYNLFVRDIGRNPTNVECFDLSQSNSEHSRHWFFKGRLVIDGTEVPRTLLDIIQEPYRANPHNSVIAFKDNSSAIIGYPVHTIIPESRGKPSCSIQVSPTYHIIFTAETHNFPSGVAPFPGAETGTGGRIRDVQATGRGGLVVAGTAAYCVGNLHIPGYVLPWENRTFHYPRNLASPLDIEIQASNGASDYGNKFGEPVIQGFTRSFGMRLTDGERYEWVKPIMFTGGIGYIDSHHVEKREPEEGMFVVKVGGPAYRIGIGGGAASSMIQGENIEELDFNAVQRGDAEMEQKLNRVIRACVEMDDANPIVSIHDQGAGGNCNVVKEIIYPAGAKIDLRKILLGDRTLSVLEIWGAEYQEQNAFLIRPDDFDMFQQLCLREKVPCAVIGRITGDGYIILFDQKDDTTPVNLSLEKILGDMPQKTFQLQHLPSTREPFSVSADLTVREALERVLRLISVGSKRFLTNKVDRSVTGLIARQQCAGPLQLTVSDVAVIAQSHFGVTGAALSIGEQPVKSLLDPSAMARMSVAEALTNIVWAKISALEDIKCSGNWMWAAKLQGEGAKLYDAAVAVSTIMTDLGIAIDGGKDSLSMAAQITGRTESERETVKSPGTLVISAYAPCPDVTKVITPDLKKPGQGRLLYIDLGGGQYRIGGSALAYVYNQIGNESPDIENTGLLKRTFKAIQMFIERGLIISGHDRSDGGLITTLLEMAFAGNCGLAIDIQKSEKGRLSAGAEEPSALSYLFSEEAGLVVEYMPEHEESLFEILHRESLPYLVIGTGTSEKRISIRFQGDIVLDEDMCVLRDMWEETSFQLECIQANIRCAEEERKNNFDRSGPELIMSFTPYDTPPSVLEGHGNPRVAIIREEGSNSDREMTSAFYHAGFETWDVTMTDFLEKRISLRDFRGIAFVGGFSYADVLDSAKGWAGVIQFNRDIWEEFNAFYHRKDTFSLGVCNGCQLMALLGWVPWYDIAREHQPRFIQNTSGRFESRFSTVTVLESPSIMLKGMEGSVLGIWVAHGEGRAYFPDEGICKEVNDSCLAPVRYVDDGNKITMKYPFNPNGSYQGIAALCSPEGRHLAIMPHPERTFLPWQWPWMPVRWRRELTTSPWLRMFQNAREWCEEQERVEGRE